MSKQARTDLVDLIAMEGKPWSGRLDDVAFLSRLFDLAELPSTDTRFKNAEGDIWQHRVNNPDDWDDGWVFHDRRFDIGGNDERLLRFVCEMLHPLVRPDKDERARLSSLFNEILRPEGWELVEGPRKVAGGRIYVARPLADDRRVLADAAEQLADVLDSAYVSKQVQRMEAAVESDPDLAIGTAKEFVETITKSILDERGISHDEKTSLTGLVRAAAVELKLTAEQIDPERKASKSIRQVLGSLASTVQGLAEIRNAYGTGHGKKSSASGLQPRHAQLAVGAAITVGTFLYQTHMDRA